MKFIKGMVLSEQLYQREVSGILKQHFKQLTYAAALLGPGSEVLGFDTARSMDHDWGARLMLFLKEEDYRLKDEIHDLLRSKLRRSILGFPTSFQTWPENNVKLMKKSQKGKKINHGIVIYTLKDFFKSYLGINPFKKIKTTDWLVMSEQKLRTIRSGKIFHDKIGLQKIQDKLHYYPKDVWLYLLASEWTKIAEEEAFIGRCHETADHIGVQIIVARLVESIMRLVFMMKQEYVPYSKWFGTAFSKLTNTKKLQHHLKQLLTANSLQAKEKSLSKIYHIIGKQHNALKITKKLDSNMRPFHDRPYLVIHADRYADAIMEQIKNKQILNIGGTIGSTNQITNNVKVLSNNEILWKMTNLYK